MIISTSKPSHNLTKNISKSTIFSLPVLLNTLMHGFVQWGRPLVTCNNFSITQQKVFFVCLTFAFMITVSLYIFIISPSRWPWNVYVNTSLLESCQKTVFKEFSPQNQMFVNWPSFSDLFHVKKDLQKREAKTLVYCDYQQTSKQIWSGVFTCIQMNCKALKSSLSEFIILMLEK